MVRRFHVGVPSAGTRLDLFLAATCSDLSRSLSLMRSQMDSASGYSPRDWRRLARMVFIMVGVSGRSKLDSSKATMRFVSPFFL